MVKHIHPDNYVELWSRSTLPYKYKMITEEIRREYVEIKEYEGDVIRYVEEE